MFVAVVGLVAGLLAGLRTMRMGRVGIGLGCEREHRGNPTHPSFVHGLHTAQGHVDGAVDRGTCAPEDSRHDEGSLVMVHDASGPHAVGDHDGIPQRIAQSLGHFGAEGDIPVADGSRTLTEGDGLPTPEPEVLVEGIRGPDDAISAMVVAQRVGDGPGNGRMVSEICVGVPVHGPRGRSESEHRVEQQLDRT